ncbi:DUF4159 domain-containing protein [Rhodovarius crocodyli]|uniref:DUF4159 domain-containing protein n=1 Tax=Rhodovarius crocodyli TaxID=1979269 RepID=A0A437MNA7_9PROT|nr:DUF4159 domain-containing protein [Rhodovarius crocodyli]RVT99134.1 DUF4159 domain-containing protein [Rhodovarius crocodyli]
MSFASPFLLLALLALPVLWWLLRVLPPQPRRETFPALFLLRALPLQEETVARTPWYILLLRCLVVIGFIIGLANPIIGLRDLEASDAVRLLVVDDGWASGRDWSARRARALADVDAAGRDGARVALATTAFRGPDLPPVVTPPMPAPELRATLEQLLPKPWPRDHRAAATAINAWRANHRAPLRVTYLADGLADEGLVQSLRDLGRLEVRGAFTQPRRILVQPRQEGEALVVSIVQTPGPLASDRQVVARTADGRAVGRVTLRSEAGSDAAGAVLQLPTEIRNQVTSLEIEGEASAGSVFLLDERFRRRPVGLLSGAVAGAETPLLGEFYYLERALQPFAEIRRGGLETLLSRALSVLVVPDRAIAAPSDQALVADWVNRGGVLLRFAGSVVAEHPDPLLPVRLRNERALGGGMSWETPQTLGRFPEASPFAGLVPPPDVTIRRQVLADPSPRLNERTWARLADGTPLITAEQRGAGWIVLFHVPPTAEWSNLVLSGTFVRMLRLIVAQANGTGSEATADGLLPPNRLLDGFGQLGRPSATAGPLNAASRGTPSPRNPPGWYGNGSLENGGLVAFNLGDHVQRLEPLRLPDGLVAMEMSEATQGQALGPWFLLGAMALLLLDLLVAARLRGLLGVRQVSAVGCALLLLGVPLAHGQEGGFANAPRLAYVATGDAALDDTLRRGMAGLSDYVNRRTSVSLAEPQGVEPGSSDLSLFPLLYWAVTANTPTPNAAARAALNGFMQNGGILLLDTRDEGAGEGQAPGAREALRRVTAGLSVPALAPVPEDHVLRRAFYLLNDLPGRFTGGTVWAARDQDRANDSVSPIIVGGHDWAGAWAVDDRGQNLHAAIPGGSRQRTLAYRFGVNLVIYALTGNYKGDQVHIPAILERLGN